MLMMKIMMIMVIMMVMMIVVMIIGHTSGLMLNLLRIVCESVSRVGWTNELLQLVRGPVTSAFRLRHTQVIDYTMLIIIIITYYHYCHDIIIIVIILSLSSSYYIRVCSPPWTMCGTSSRLRTVTTKSLG